MRRELEAKFGLLGGLLPIGGTFVPMTQEESDTIEADLGAVLPQDYRDFLWTYGQAAFGELVEFRPIERLPAHISDTGMGSFSDFLRIKSLQSKALRR